LAKTAITNIYNALVRFAPQHRAEFTRKRDAYLAKLNARIAEWEKAAKPLRGMKSDRTKKGIYGRFQKP